MLERSFNTALPMAQELAGNGILLSATPSSLLSELCSTSAPIEFERKLGDGVFNTVSIADYGFMLNTNTMGETGARWGASFDDATKHLAGLIRNHISYIRNVVKPRVVEAVNEASVYVQELGGTNPASQLEISKLSIPEFASDPAFLILLDSFKNREVVRPNGYSLNFNFKAPPDDFKTAFTTGNARIDTLVNLWANSLDIDFLKQAWYVFFCGGELLKTYNGSMLSQDDMFSPNLSVRLNTALAYFLIANYYDTHLPDVSTNQDLSVVKNRIYDHLLFAGTTLYRAMEQINANNKAGLLVLHIDQLHKKITVSDEIYSKWLATGGTAEVILGILVGDKKYYVVKDIIDNTEELKRSWSRYTGVYLESVEYKKANSLRNYYRSLMSKYLTSDYCDANEKEFLINNPNYHQNTLEKVEKLLDGMKKEELLQVESVILKLIAGIKYGFTCAQTFLEDMLRVQKQNANADSNEAACVATLNYITDYLLGQIQVNKV